MKYLKLTIFLFSCGAFSQQDAQYTQYMYNTIIVNPAYAGSSGMASFNAIYRTQWLGLEGAPVTQTFSISSPFGSKIGIGLSGTNDIIGPSKQTTFLADFAYKLKLNNKGLYLSMGVKAGVDMLKVDYTEIKIKDTNDEYLQENMNKVSPKVGIGLYLYSKKWYMGASAPSIISTNFYSGENVSIKTAKLHMYFIGGYVFDIDREFKLKPTSLIKYVQGSPLSIDLSLNMMIGNKLILGASYRFSDSISLLTSIMATDNLTIGYAYDTKGVSIDNSGSHELFLRLDMSNRVRGKISPRFF
ncbi:MAG: type IX secretion system membrane protein PorP/SprF [Flavobacteriaceae bacterium]|nr:type IX secretion system membrane protein PorP/SprF [Flavobacteriaceae bacterium]